MLDFKDKVVLVTGAGKGLSREIAEAFAKRGAIVVANDITPVNLDGTATSITASGGRVKSYVEDVARKMTVQALVNQVLEDLDRIDILINCAEVELEKPILEMDDWDWQRTLDVNLTGAFLPTQTAGRVMKAQSGGIIIHIGGQARRLEQRAAYFASRAGLAEFVRRAAQELRVESIRVYIVLPEGTADIPEKVLSLCP